MNYNQRILYACGQIGMMGLARYFFQWIISFAKSPLDTTQPAAVAGGGVSLVSATLFSGAAVGAVLLGFRIFDGVTDPIAGMVSDFWVRKGHQRRTLLWFSFFLPSIGLVLCFMPTPEMISSTRWIFLVIGMFVFFVGYTFYGIPYWSLIEDYGGANSNERRILSNILGVGLLIAVAIAGIVSPLLVESHGYTSAATAFALTGAVLMMFPYFAAPKQLRSAALIRKDQQLPLFAALINSFRHRRFVSVLVMFAGSQMSFTVVTSAAPFIAVSLLDGTKGDVVWIMGAFLATSIPAFAVVPIISRALGWERAVIIASLTLGLVYAASAGLGQEWIGSKWMTASIIFALAGPMAAVLFGLEGEAITACARERDAADCVSIYFGVYNFIVKALNGLAILIAGWLTDLAEGPEYGTAAIRAMSLTAGALLAVCVIIYFLIRPQPGQTETAG